MKLSGAWKFWLTLVVTIAGVAVPVWLWQTDLSSKALSIRLVTNVPLQSKEQESIPGMEISVNGAKLDKPHLIVFQIRNDGRKPILAADFESPLDIRLESKTSFVRAGITDKMPRDIEASIKLESQRFSLKPSLLNPKDLIEITAITSGDTPVFSSKARVAAISNVYIEDSTKEKPSKIRLALILSSSLLCWIALSLMVNVLVEPKELLRRRSVAAVIIATGIGGMMAFDAFVTKIEFTNLWLIFLFYVSLMVVANIIASVLNNKGVSDTSKQNDK